MQIRSSVKIGLASTVVLLAACRGGKNDGLDPMLQNDLSLASQAQAYRQQQFVSPQELGAQQYPYGQPGMYPNGYAPMPVQAGYANGPYYAPAPYPAPYPAPAPVRERVVYRTRSAGSGSSRGSSSGGGGYVYRAPAPTVKKNTKRDAVIGAAAGAAIGVATSARKDRLKGGLLGAVIGAAAGAVVGNNVDKQHIPF
jgi:hypothetical protein